MSSESSEEPTWTPEQLDWLRSQGSQTTDEPAVTSGHGSAREPGTASTSTPPARDPWSQSSAATPPAQEPWAQPASSTPPPPQPNPWAQPGTTPPPPAQDPWAQPATASPPARDPWAQPGATQDPWAQQPGRQAGPYSAPGTPPWPQQPFQQAGGYPPGQGSYGPYQPQYFGPGIPRNNPCAIAALICGIGQFVLGLLVVGNILLAIPAIICGSIGLRQIARRGERGRGLAIAGLVLGILGVLYFLVVVVLVAVNVHTGSST
jgi:Domain of unknown function (DUF4190)